MKEKKQLFSMAILVTFLSMFFSAHVLSDDTNGNTSVFLFTCKTCGKDVAMNALTCPYCGENLPALRIKCPKCQSTNIVSEKQGFSSKRAAVGCCLFGGVGLAGGAIGMHNEVFMCRTCGHRWKTQESPDNIVIAKSPEPTPYDKGCLVMCVILASFFVVLVVINELR